MPSTLSGMAAPRSGSSPSRDQPDPDAWFRHSFDALYLELYAHRDEREARDLIASLARVGCRGPVLEVACGAGRFLAAWADRGEAAVGLDLSAPLLARARRRLGPSARLVRGDMRRLPLAAGRFGLVLFLFTSFGYFVSREEDREVLREAARVLAPGGRLLLDVFNAAVTLGRLVPETVREVGGRAVREIRWIDPAGPYLRKRIEVEARGGGERREERVRIYSPEELAALVESAGLPVGERWGDYLGSPFDGESSERCLLWARKEVA